MDRESRGQDLRLCSSETQGIMPTGDTFSECQRVLEVVAGEEFQRSESRMWRNFEGDSGAEGRGRSDPVGSGRIPFTLKKSGDGRARHLEIMPR